jgi:predicted secreted protein
MLDITPSTTVATLQNCSHTLANAFTAYNLNGVSYLRNELGYKIGTIQGTETFRKRILTMLLKNKKKNKPKTDDQLLKQFNKEVNLRRALKDITSIASSDSSQVSK